PGHRRPGRQGGVGEMKIGAVTSCPTGIAHTYMAAESLEEAAREAGHSIAVETQGAAGANPLTDEQIASADVVVLAADVEVRNRERFAGKPTVIVPIKRAINDTNAVLDQAAALLAAAPAPAPTSASTPPPARPAATPARADQGPSGATRVRQWLMTGVSYMIPFVAAGGILIALSFVIGGAQIATKVNGGTFHGVTYPGVTDISRLLEQTGVAGVMFKIGGISFSML